MKERVRWAPFHEQLLWWQLLLESRCLTVFASYCVSTETSIHGKEGWSRAHARTVYRLPKMLQTHWWLTSTGTISPPGEGQGGRGDVRRSPSGLSEGGEQGPQAQHRLDSCHLAHASPQFGLLCLQPKESNQHTFADNWAHRLRQQRKWLNVIGRQWYGWN